MQMEQALPAAETSVGSDYRWAILNVDAIIGGHSFPAGTRIAVAPSQTQTSGGGKAHTTSIVTKVWAKFGQTFDSSSWIEGWLAANLFTYTGQAATWSSSTGFGATPAVAPSSGASMSFGAGMLIGAMIGVLGTIAGTILYENFAVSPKRRGESTAAWRRRTGR